MEDRPWERPQGPGLLQQKERPASGRKVKVPGSRPFWLSASLCKPLVPGPQPTAPSTRGARPCSSPQMAEAGLVSPAPGFLPRLRSHHLSHSGSKPAWFLLCHPACLVTFLGLPATLGRLSQNTHSQGEASLPLLHLEITREAARLSHPFSSHLCRHLLKIRVTGAETSKPKGMLAVRSKVTSQKGSTRMCDQCWGGGHPASAHRAPMLSHPKVLPCLPFLAGTPICARRAASSHVPSCPHSTLGAPGGLGPCPESRTPRLRAGWPRG